MSAVSEPRQALAGVTVLDLATYLAAPVCAILLGEFGADVIKVEQPRVGDDLRRLGRPVSPGTPTVPDYLAGVFGAVGALVALRHAERSGEGQIVDLALYEPVLRVLDDAIAVYGGTGQVRERIGSGTESAVPHNHYQTRDGRWIAIACTNDRMFARLLQAMDRPDLAGDARVTTTPARVGNRALVDGLVAGWVGERDAGEALAALEAADVPSSLVASVRDLFEDAHVRARENIVSAVLPLLGRISMPGVVPRLTATPGRIESAGPSTPGEHNEEIYCGRLGLSAAELTGLHERGVI